MTGIVDLARAIAAEGHDFLTWAEWFPGGRPDKPSPGYPGWTKLHMQGFPSTTHWVHHSVTSSDPGPASAANTVNRIGISRFGKMSYPFLIHRSGTIIQGCYPYIGAHTKNFNSTTLAGCNIGNYQANQPTRDMVVANAALIRALRATGHYARDVPVKGHRQSEFAQTSCPGDYLMAQIPRIIQLAYNPPPIPSPTPTIPPEADVFLLKSKDDAKVWLVEPGRYTHITNATNMAEVASALDVPANPALVDQTQFALLVKNRIKVE